MKIILGLLIFILAFFVFPSKTAVNFPNPQVQENIIPQEISLITTGDVIPARSVNWKMTKYGNFAYPFLKTADILKSADLTLINLESPLIPDCPVTTEGMVFCGNQKFIEGLLFAGIDVANLANNHSLNWGKEGYEQTKNLLGQNNILVSNGNLSKKLIKGITFGFLGWNILDNPSVEEILSTIKAAKKSGVNFLIVSFHWGAEYQRFPDKNTISLARQAIDNGADLIVGNHPHWYQPIEIYQEKPIVYAHGNFIFDQEWSEQTKTGFIVKYTISQNKVKNMEILPIFISDYSQPEFLEGFEKEAILEDLKTIFISPPNNLGINPQKIIW